jgi:hypothetical protein
MNFNSAPAVTKNVGFVAFTAVLPTIETFLGMNMGCDHYDIPKRR